MGDVRGQGLFIGIEMVKNNSGKEPDVARAMAFANELKNRSFLTSNAGALGNVLKIRPPLVISQTDADEFMAAFDATLESVR